MDNLESGRDISSSLARHPNIFSPLYISMVKVGEETGRLDESFFRISSYLTREKETREQNKSSIALSRFCNNCDSYCDSYCQYLGDSCVCRFICKS